MCHRSQVSFTAHPDLAELAKKYEPLTSNYFRRGRFYGSQDLRFQDVIDVLEMLFKNNTRKVKMLIGGIGESQEPFSMLAVTKDILKGKPIKDNIDLYIIDLQSKPDNWTLFKQSFLDTGTEPIFAQNSFKKVKGRWYQFFTHNKYRVKDDIFEYLKKTYNNPKKSYWESRIQETIPTMEGEDFSVVAINNTMGYFDSIDTIHRTVENTMKTIKKDGIFITDPDYPKENVLVKYTEELFPGIYQKK